jgi:DNA-directed RNA polymerase specialized sigma24 family protein
VTAAAVAVLAAQIDPMELDNTTDWPWDDGANPDLWLYRDRTLAMLKRYMRLSVEVGRLPSLLGREFFRTRVTSYHVATFEDTVIFVHDVERMLSRLDPFSQKLIAKIALQEYTQDEAARLLGCWRRTVGRRYQEALDRLSEMFLEGGLLRPFENPGATSPKSCQEAEMEENPASDCIECE